MVNKPLIRPYFWGGYVARGGWLTSHYFSNIHTTLRNSHVLLHHSPLLKDSPWDWQRPSPKVLKQRCEFEWEKLIHMTSDIGCTMVYPFPPDSGIFNIQNSVPVYIYNILI